MDHPGDPAALIIPGCLWDLGSLIPQTLLRSSHRSRYPEIPQGRIIRASLKPSSLDIPAFPGNPPIPWISPHSPEIPTPDPQPPPPHPSPHVFPPFPSLPLRAPGPSPPAPPRSPPPLWCLPPLRAAAARLVEAAVGGLVELVLLLGLEQPREAIPGRSPRGAALGQAHLGARLSRLPGPPRGRRENERRAIDREREGAAVRGMEGAAG